MGELRLLFVLDSLSASAGGPARSVPGLALAMHERGAEVTLLCGPSPLPVELAAPMAERLCDVERPVGMWRTSAGVRQLREAYETWRDETSGGQRLVHLQHIWSPIVHHLARWARRDGIPYVVSPRGMLMPRALRQKRWKKRLALCLYQRRDLRGAAALHVTSELEAEHLARLGFTEHVGVVPNGIEAPPGLTRPANSGEPRTALFLSRLHPTKNVNGLLKAWQRLRPAGWRLVIAGPDELGMLAAHKRFVEANGLTDSVTFLGALDDSAKWSWYARADLFVLPTHTENFGIVIAEALAAGVPVITTHGAPWPAITEQDLGWWIPHGEEPLVAALATATTGTTDHERREKGERGRTYIREHYAWTSIAAAMEDLYRHALRKESVSL